MLPSQISDEIWSCIKGDNIELNQDILYFSHKPAKPQNKNTEQLSWNDGLNLPKSEQEADN